MEPDLQLEIAADSRELTAPGSTDNLIEVRHAKSKDKHGPAGAISDRADAFS